jgi:hypothetical protein
MHWYHVTLYSAYSMACPVAATLVRFRRMKSKYLPLTILIGLGAVNETISIFSSCHRSYTSVNGNIYVLLEFLCIVWLYFHLCSGLSKKFLITTAFLGLALWTADNIIVNSLHSNNSLFRMAASFLIVFLSMDKITQAVLAGGLVETSRSDLLLSAGFLVYYTYKAFVEAFHLFPLHPDKSFYIILWVILGIINMIVNLMFALAILCISRKTHISTRS